MLGIYLLGTAAQFSSQGNNAPMNWGLNRAPTLKVNKAPNLAITKAPPLT